MNMKMLAIFAVCAAVIGAGISGAVIANKRASAAASAAEAEASRAEKAASEARKAEAEAKSAAEKRRAAEADEKAKADGLAAAKEARAKAEAESRAAADSKVAAMENSKAEQAKSAAAIAARDEARAKTREAEAKSAEAKQNARAAEAAAAEAEAKLEAEKLKADKILAEAKILELRKIDFETLARDLADWNADLEERERALMPEKTVADLSWAGGMEDTVIDADGNVKKQVKIVYDPEKDMSLPPGTRRLIREERLSGEAVEANAVAVRDSLVAKLAAMRGEAQAEGRVIDAEFYGKTIESLYPGWRPDEGESK